MITLKLPRFPNAQKATLIREALSSKITNRSGTLVHTFLGHFSPFRRTLTGLETRISLVNNIKSALALDDLAVSVAAFGRSERGKNFHRTSG